MYRTEYGYDVDGNLTSDRNKGINSISYNHLNLPTRITTGDGTVDYVYDAIGTKLKKVVDFLSIPTNTKIYDAGFIYTNDVLSLITQPEGYVEPDGNGSFTYAYNYIDHLGNVRLTYKDSNGNGSVTTSEIIEEKNYFPFGLQHKGYNYIVQGENSAATQFGYNGMENNPELGLEILDFGARNYDPALGKWMNIDPLAEQMRRHSPYNYAFNNPVFFIDPDGMAPASFGWGHISVDAEDKTGDEQEEEEERKEESHSNSNLARQEKSAVINGFIDSALSSSGDDDSKLHIFDGTKGKSESDAYKFMFSNSIEDEKEVSAFVSENAVYVFPWLNNTREGSEMRVDGFTLNFGFPFSEDANKLFGHFRGQSSFRILAQVHTHPDHGGADGAIDLETARGLRVPMYIISSNRVSYLYDFREAVSRKDYKRRKKRNGVFSKNRAYDKSIRGHAIEILSKFGLR